MQNNVLDYLYKIVQEKPEKTAFSDGSISFSFAQVHEYCKRIGSYLSDAGIFRKPVVVFMKKSPMEIAAFFGIVAGGNFYVPIDEEMPRVRIQMILDNVRSPLIVCDETTMETARTFDVGTGRPVLCEEMVRHEADEAALEKIYGRVIDTDPVYIVFTSGSTGVPKGVAACHRSVIDYIEQLSGIMGFNEDTVFGNQSPLYFDACLKELYPTLKFGATTYLIPKELFSFPVKLVEFLNANQINTICWVVSALTMVSAFGTFDVVKPEYLHTVAFGSEVFPPKQFRRWRDAVPEASFTNLYGPTETTGMCCYYRVEREFADGEVIPIGRPFPNREILLLSEDGSQVEGDGPGEICIRGTALTLGYYNDHERSKEVFVQNPLNDSYRELIYKTGDIGRYNEDGELCFVSRKDFQVKHMGYRIELGEIEANVNTIAGIRLSACVYDKVKSKIVLYYVGDIAEKELIMEMKKMLPYYMRPNKTVRLTAMPFTAGGKIDRVKLQGGMGF